MATQADLTTLSPAFKTLYPPEAIKDIMYKDNPLLALLAKDESFFGASSTEPLIYAESQNRSASFSAANSVVTTASMKAFLLTRVQNYSTAAISNEAMLASESDKGAFIRIAKLEIDKALLSISRAIASQLYRSGTGVVARISHTATLNSTTVYIALANPEDIVNLSYGMSIAVSGTDGGAVRSGTAFIRSIDRQAGSFLCSATFGGSIADATGLITGLAVDDYIYPAAGDRNAVISGLKAWLPGSAVSATTFFGVDRTPDKTRLAGVDYDGSAQSIEEALVDGANRIAREGGRPDHCFVSFKDYSNLVKAIGSKQQFIQYTDVKVSEPGVNIGFASLMLNGPKGPLKVIPDSNCPSGFAFLLQLDTWKLKSLGELVKLFDGDGLSMIRDPNGDNLLVRCFSYAQLSCRAPGYNGVVTLPS